MLGSQNDDWSNIYYFKGYLKPQTHINYYWMLPGPYEPSPPLINETKKLYRMAK